MTMPSPGATSRVGMLATRLAGYATPERALFRCRQTFLGVDLEGKQVLEIGAGAGVFSAYAAAAGARHVVALEPEAAGSTAGAASAIQAMRQELGAAHFEVRAETVQNYDSQGRFFDVVLLYNSINHLDEGACMALGHGEEARAAYRALFDRIARRMGRGARLIIADCSRHNFFGMLGLRSPLAGSIEWSKHQAPRTWARLLEPLGFVRERLDWYTFHPLRHLGCLAANAVVSFFLSSHFRLVMRYEGRPQGHFA